MLAKVHTLMINDEEARLLAEEHNLRSAAAKILKLGPTSLIIKRGDAGALLFHGGGAFAAPAMPLWVGISLRITSVVSAKASPGEL